MDFPKTQNWVGLVGDRFANPNMEQGREGSRVPAEYLNALGEEIAQVIEGQGMALQEGNNTQLNEALQQALNNVIPLGTLLPLASHLSGSYEIPQSGQVSPQGFMRCDGAAIPAGNRLQGTTPNLTDGRFLRGSTLAGGTGGSESFTLSQANLPAHAHTIDHNHNASSGQAGAHNHGTHGGIQGLQWKAAVPGNVYFNHGTYPIIQYEYTKRRGAGWARFIRPEGGWEYSHTTSKSVQEEFGPGHDVRTVVIHTYHYRRRVAFNQPTKYQLAGGSFSIRSGGAHTHPVSINPYAGQSGSVGSRAAKVHLPKYFNVQYVIKVN